MTFSRKGKGKNLEDGTTRFGFEPVSVLRDLGEDAGFAGASSGSERDDTNNVVGAAAVGADEGTAGISHAGRPSANFTEADNVIWKRPVLPTESRSGPDFSGDLSGKEGNEPMKSLMCFLLAQRCRFNNCTTIPSHSVDKSIKIQELKINHDLIIVKYQFRRPLAF